MEASAQIRQASPQPDYEAVKARVITRAFGFRLGPLGVDYASRQVELDPEERAGRKRREGAGSHAAGEFCASRAANGASAASAGAPFESVRAGARPAPAPPPDHPDPVWRRGLAAYAKARDLPVSAPSSAALGVA